MRNPLPLLLLIALVLSLGIASLSRGDSALSAGPDTLAIRPSSITVATGETFTLDVKIEGSAAATSSDVQILFDTNYLECLSVAHSGIFPSYFIDKSNLATGLIWFGGGTFSTAVTPPVVFVTLQFRAKNNSGTTNLTFNSAECDIQGDPSGSVLGSLVDGVVTIQEPSTSTPTATSTSTATATATGTATWTPTTTSTSTATATPTATGTATLTPTSTSATKIYLPLVLRQVQSAAARRSWPAPRQGLR